MANQLDEMNPEIMSEGRDVNVIAKVIPVELVALKKCYLLFLWLLVLLVSF